MPVDTDPASAARRVAERSEAAKRAGHTDIALRMDEVAALLPFLNAVAAGSGADRVERWAETICRADCRGEQDTHVCDRQADGSCKPGKCVHAYSFKSAARAAIALADAEAAVRRAEDQAAAETEQLTRDLAADLYARLRNGEPVAETLKEPIDLTIAMEGLKRLAGPVALDAAVRALAGR